MRKVLAGAALMLPAIFLNQVAVVLGLEWGIALAALAATIGYGLLATSPPVNGIWLWAAAGHWGRKMGTVILAGLVTGAAGAALAGLFIWTATRNSSPVAPATQAPNPGASREDRIERLLAEQARIAAVPIQPRFSLDVSEEGEGEEVIESVEVWNEGPAPTDYQVFQHTFLRIQRADTGDVRFVPTYYFMDRRPTMHLDGLLTTLLAVNPRASDHPWNNQSNEVARIEREIKEEFGQFTSLTREFYLSIFYTDISGTHRHQGFELGPSRGMHGPLTNWRRDDFNGDGFMALTASGWGIDHLWQITGLRIRERWDAYLTPQDFYAAARGER